MKKLNEYVRLYEGDLYRDTPKAVFAAVAASLLTSGGDRPEVLMSEFIKEWSALHIAGIVSQKTSAT